jgi:hypothetical protein
VNVGAVWSKLIPHLIAVQRGSPSYSLRPRVLVFFPVTSQVHLPLLFGILTSRIWVCSIQSDLHQKELNVSNWECQSYASCQFHSAGVLIIFGQESRKRKERKYWTFIGAESQCSGILGNLQQTSQYQTPMNIKAPQGILTLDLESGSQNLHPRLTPNK